MRRSLEPGLRAALFSGPGRSQRSVETTRITRHGRVLCGSVDLDMLACAAPNGTDLVRIQSEGYPALEVDLRDLKVREEEKNSSPALVRGVAARLAELGCVRRALTLCDFHSAVRLRPVLLRRL